MPKQIYLWEYALSPHLGNVLKGMVKRGYKAHYVVHSETYAHRKAGGWVRPEFPGVEILQPSSRKEIRDIIARSAPDDVHICVGLRANHHVRNVSAELRTVDRRFLMFMETINERSTLRLVKRFLYRALFLRNRYCLEGVLATGATTSDWVAARGVPPGQIFDFAYFLSPPEDLHVLPRTNSCFRLLFVGSLVALKRVHLIIEALSDLPHHVTLDVVGDGPLRATLDALAKTLAPDRVTFHGTRPMTEIAKFMTTADCLVLPSDHDGWGAVVSEAMMAGTPVVCSDRCGATAIVRASCRGQVFQTFTPNACADALRAQVALGPVTPTNRAALADWAVCLTEQPGAEYLDAIIAHLRGGAVRPSPPWSTAGPLPPLSLETSN